MSLSVRGFKASYPEFELRVDEMTVEPGSLTAVIGRSGSGKSTLLQTIAGFLSLEEGQITNAGTVISHLPAEQRKTAVVFQRGALFSHLTIGANVEFGPRCQGVPAAERKARSARWLSRLGLSDLALRLPHEISGGQAQRVALARAFAVGFPALLLDEPFSALDRELREQLRPILRSLVQETQVAALLVTHDVADVLACADRVVVIENGKVVESGSVDVLKTQAQSAYGRHFFNLEVQG